MRGVNGSKSIRSEPNHSRAIVIMTGPLLLLLFELLARYQPSYHGNPTYIGLP